MKRITIILTTSLMILGLGAANAQDATSMAELLELIQQGQSRDSQEARQRETQFKQRHGQQQNLLNQSRSERTRQERESSRLEQLFETQQADIVSARAALDERLGALKELFGVLQTVSGDTQGRFNTSLTNLQFPEREAFLVALGSKMASATELASIKDIETLWGMLQQEVNESGKIVRFDHQVTKSDGQQSVESIIRIGAFNIISDAGYLQVKQDGTVAELARQPEGRLTGAANDLMDATEGSTSFGLDVTRGGILGLLVQSKTIKDRIEDGGIVGYCIIALGALGLLMAIWRWFGLSGDSRRVSAQLKRDKANTDNPLGRVLAAYESNQNADTETIELKLSEAALKEMPGLTKGLLFIKVISVVAPLMGLLGTVTGMIKTFQVITLYGAGDPKLMAGGISQALMTTVLGLVVAIPMVLLHTVVSGQSRKIINILQSQSAGLVAQHSESHG